MSEDLSRVRFERVHFAVRLNLIQFPLGEDEIDTVLKKASYSLTSPRGELMAGIPLGVRVMPAGRIGRSADGECLFSLFPDRGIIALQGTSIDRVIDDFKVIQSTISELYIPDWDTKVLFYEFVLDANVRVGPERDPIEEMGALHTGSALFDAVGKALGIAATTFGLRLTEVGGSPDQSHWLEYKIEPDVAKSRTHYTVNIICRDPQFDVVVDQAKQAMTRTSQVLEIMKERGV